VAQRLEGNAARVLAARRRHTALRHFLGVAPYQRAARKIAQYAREQAAVRGSRRGRALCDALCDAWLARSTQAPSGHRAPTD
jgi:hypothetical protein